MATFKESSTAPIHLQKGDVFRARVSDVVYKLEFVSYNETTALLNFTTHSGEDVSFGKAEFESIVENASFYSVDRNVYIDDSR